VPLLHPPDVFRCVRRRGGCTAELDDILDLDDGRLYAGGMCVVLYIASDVPLPLIPFDESAPAFNVSELRKQSGPVRKHFTKQYVYEAGSHTQCGCGFEVVAERYGVKFDTDPAEVNAGCESRRRLAAYLRQALSAQESVELFVCWDGEEERETTRRVTLVPEDLIDKHPCFLDWQDFAPEFLTVVRR